MSGYLITGALIVPVDDSQPDYFRGDLQVGGERIVKIARYPDSIEPADDITVIDGQNMILMPGLVNTHGHAAMTLFRGYADDLPLKEWLEKKIWPVENLLDGEDVYWGTMLAIVEMLKGGTTTFTDMYFFMDRVAEAAAESHIRGVLARGLIGFGLGANVGLKEAERLYNNWHGKGNGRITVTLGPHAPYTCPPGYLKKVMKLAEKTGAGLQIHLAETAGEIEDCRKQYGVTPARLMADLKLFDYPVIAAHCVHLSKEDIAILAEHNVRVSHNPGSNLKLGSGIAPLPALLDAGVTTGLGTDGASSNNNLDLWEEMRLASLLAKGTAQDPTLIPAKTALRLATVEGARVLNMPEVGQLKEGFKADLIGVDCRAAHLNPLFDPIAHLVYAAGASDVKLVMVDGKILVQNRALTALDEEKIIFEASARAYRLTGKRKIER